MTVTASELQEAYDALIQAREVLMIDELDMCKAKQALDRAVAKALYLGIEGKNQKEREVQLRQHLKGQYLELDKQKYSLTRNRGEYELAKLRVQKLKRLMQLQAMEMPHGQVR